MKGAPFATHHQAGITWVDRGADEAFREALMIGVPPALRGKMKEALAATPDAGARAHSIRYFGAEFETVRNDAATLAMLLSRTLANTHNLPGFLDWLDVTNYGNDYRMIKVFKAWAETKKSEPLPTLIPRG